ncbi:GNAT family N-acetyltransferase [Oculatella sp. LEGE 06141]|nr:GNAT family N-acetyltransferase [Oculatella sp. LEGE 06141]MBE9182386.1 GNAT family N-acetyltransferase [Oculatella sp. LEGE 06141]
MKYDRLAPLDQQLQWLETVGFQHVDCWYKHFSFAVFGGQRCKQDVPQQQPVLYTERLILRPFTLADASTVQQLVGDRDVAAKTLSISHPYEDGMAEAWIKTHALKFAKRQTVTFAIVLQQTNQLCGAIGLHIEADYNSAEMGYWIGKPFWGNGYCTEAAAEVVRYGFDQLHLHRIEATHFSTNPASGRVMQKVGMRHEGHRRQYTLKWGKYEDVELYGILKSDWQQ